MRDANETQWWRRTGQLAALTVGGAAAVVAVPALFSGLFSAPLVFGLPFGTFLLIVFAPLFVAGCAFAFAGRQQALDRRHDVAEE